MSAIEYRSLILSLQDLTAPHWPAAMRQAGLNTLMLHAVRLPDDIDALIRFRDSDAGRRLAEDCHARGIRIECQMHTAG